MDNVIESSLNFWQQKLNMELGGVVLQQREGTIMDKVVISSAKYWNKVANEFLTKDTRTNSLEENISSQAKGQ